jgi:ribosomal 50S subunit-recycling heat shock protein
VTADRLRVEVPAPLRGARLDRFLAALDEVGSRGAAERLVEEGRVLVDGSVRHKSFRVLPGMSIEVDVPPATVGRSRTTRRCRSASSTRTPR